jgi:hypothetical protein
LEAPYFRVNTSIHQAFELQVTCTPQIIVQVSEYEYLTYEDVREKIAAGDDNQEGNCR